MLALKWITPVVLLLGFAAGCAKQGARQAQMPPPQVIVATARVQPVAEQLSQVANIEANEMVEIKAEADGIVQEILFEEGQVVKKGDLLVRLDETKLAASLEQTEANFKLAEANYERSKQLFSDKLISRQEFDQAAAVFHANKANLEYMRRQLRDARIYAPFEGVIGARQISPGQLITKNTIITWLIDLDPVKVEFHVPERFLGQVRLKQQIQVKVEAFPNEEFKGEVFFVSPFVDPTNRTALVKAAIPNPKLMLKPGMYANLNLILAVRERATVIPEAAITQILTNSQAIIFAVDSSGNAQMRRIKTGIRLAGAVEVLEGVAPGEQVIVEGLQKVIPGAPVRIAPAEGSSAPAVAARNS